MLPVLAILFSGAVVLMVGARLILRRKREPEKLLGAREYYSQFERKDK